MWSFYLKGFPDSRSQCEKLGSSPPSDQDPATAPPWSRLISRIQRIRALPHRFPQRKSSGPTLPQRKSAGHSPVNLPHFCRTWGLLPERHLPLRYRRRVTPTSRESPISPDPRPGQERMMPGRESMKLTPGQGRTTLGPGSTTLDRARMKRLG